MASNAILATLSHIIACSPCVGTFGRWKTDLQDDDADLWNDLTLINSIPDVRPPGIPKVVEVVSCSDRSDEDVSTLAYETIFHQHYHSSPDHRPAVSRNSNSNNNNTPREEEKSFTPSPKRTAEFLQKGNGQASRYHTHADPELEQVLEEIGLKDSNSNSSNEATIANQHGEEPREPQHPTGLLGSGGGHLHFDPSSIAVAAATRTLPLLLPFHPGENSETAALPALPALQRL
jgi:hypothetical protein